MVLYRSIEQITSTFPEGKYRGSGSFGSVYGPFQKHLMEAYITWLYPDIIHPPLKDREDYVFKLIKMDSSKLPSVYIKMYTLREALLGLEERMQKHFVFVLFLGPVKDGIVEIQKYGGIPLSMALSIKVVSLPQIHSSIMAILGGLYRICENKNILVTDIKPDNMVYTESSGISLIDLEYVDLTKNDDRIVYTNLYELMPLQMFLLPYFSQTPRIQKYKASAGARQVIPLSYRKLIGAFSLAWVMVHIYLEIVRIYFESSPCLARLQGIIDDMTEKRWSLTIPEILRKLRKIHK